ncbi:hypothetical protein M378DRAFT_163635 [Amanita muscaria Koide BX008]|uniref:Uncharacterized protein n=1 Tax=Amanita muscaria (strain Koide BX008) TaxID=946122 RepID=A0A0C2TBQ5_AMAMK|nr:hypothetical protein M378DRAFT_163635 [Amanita muscaria Koide BX008]
MAATKLCIAPVGETLPTCSPDLMPFHIDYSGPAPISTYMQVEPAKEVVGAPCMAPRSRSEAENNASTSSTNEDEDKCAKNAQQTENNASQASTSATVNHAARRFVSTFRGREIHGLDVSIPEGYTGLILQTEGQALVGNSSSLPSRERRENTEGRSKRITRKSKVLVTRDESGEIDLEMSEKVVQEVEMMDLTEETENAQNSGEDEDEYLPKRTLVPSAQFNSFRLWSADIPADQGGDEYTRSLTEWITLAHHIHHIPP